jgi:hypothetical protein
MHRAQVLIEDWQYEALKSIAAREGRSISMLLRDGASLRRYQRLAWTLFLERPDKTYSYTDLHPLYSCDVLDCNGPSHLMLILSVRALNCFPHHKLPDSITWVKLSTEDILIY